MAPIPRNFEGVIDPHEAFAFHRSFFDRGNHDSEPAATGNFVVNAEARCDASAAAPAKVAVIAFQAAVSQTNEFQRDFADLQKKYDPRRQEIKSLSDQIDTMTKQLQADDAKLTDEERGSAFPCDRRKEETAGPGYPGCAERFPGRTCRN